jgi:hypothetical protein
MFRLPERQTSRLKAAAGCPQAQKTLRQQRVQNLFVIGRASPNPAGLYGADAIRLVVVDYDAPLPASWSTERAVGGYPARRPGRRPDFLNMVYQLGGRQREQS